MDKEELYALLDNRKIEYIRKDHKAVYNMEEVITLNLPYPEREAKNLFLKDDRKGDLRSYYLLTVYGHKRVNLKQFFKTHGLRRLSFCNEQELEELLGLTPGSVTPFGLLNDHNSKVIFYLDQEFLEGNGYIAVHPMINTSSVTLKTDDLISLLEETHKVILVDVESE